MADPERAEMSASEIAVAVRCANFVAPYPPPSSIALSHKQYHLVARALLAQTATVAARDKRIEAAVAILKNAANPFSGSLKETLRDKINEAIAALQPTPTEPKHRDKCASLWGGGLPCNCGALEPTPTKEADDGK